MSGRPGPVLLLVPAFVFAAVGLYLLERRGASGPPLTAPAAFAPDLVEAWVGEAEIAGVRLSARLARLHGDPDRQEFDRRALAGRLGLGEGEPFLLELAASAGTGGAAPSGAALALERLAVEDESGPALAVLSRAEDAGPLAALLAPPAAPLRPAEEVEVFLWGRAPGGGARIGGLGATTLPAAVLALRPERVAWAELTHWLARVAPDPAEDAGGAVVR